MIERGCYSHRPGPCPDPRYAEEHPFESCYLPFSISDPLTCELGEEQCHHGFRSGSPCRRTREAHTLRNADPQKG